jgi:hypothetical protein
MCAFGALLIFSSFSTCFFFLQTSEKVFIASFRCRPAPQIVLQIDNVHDNELERLERQFDLTPFSGQMKFSADAKRKQRCRKSIKLLPPPRDLPTKNRIETSHENRDEFEWLWKKLQFFILPSPSSAKFYGHLKVYRHRFSTFTTSLPSRLCKIRSR